MLMGSVVTAATHRTRLKRVQHVWWWALERIADGVIVDKGRAENEADAIDSAVEAGHKIGLARVDRDPDATTVQMG